MAKALDPNDAKLMAAASTGDHVSLRMYAEIGGQVNAKDPTDSDRTSVHKATLGGHEMCLRWLMGLQADFGVQDSDGLTPVHLAARMGHGDCLRYMVDELVLPADPRDKEDHTPMHAAPINRPASCCVSVCVLVLPGDHKRYTGLFVGGGFDLPPIA
jgi:ankyrin repeat protein